MWWTQTMATPALVTTSPPDTNRRDAGVLGEPGTEILFGDEGLIDGTRSGGRIRFGGWLDNCQCFGLEGEYFGLSNKTDSFYASSDGEPILARPYVRPYVYIIGESQQARLIAYPDVIAGSISAGASSSLDSAGARLRLNLYRRDGGGQGLSRSRLDLLGGYRFLGLSENVSIRGQLTTIEPLPPEAFDIRDSFDARSDFHGGELGLLYEARQCQWSIELLGKVALGNSHQVVTIDGSTDRVINGQPGSFSGGLLAQRTNIGRFDDDQFAVLPEAGITLGYDLTTCLKATCGYSYIYISSVARAATQIDTVVNPLLLPPETGSAPGPARPAFPNYDSGFWAQGLTFGLEWRPLST